MSAILATRSAVQIDPEFRSYITPPSGDAISLLETMLLAEGCRDALVIWQGLLLDGHHRYHICTEHGIPFTTSEAVGVHTRDQALAWIIRNQIARRNLSPDQLSYYRGKQYELEKKEHGGDRKSEESSDQSDHLKTADRLAEELGVSAPTIRRDAKYAEAMDAIAEIAGHDARQAILTGEINSGTADGILCRLARA